MRKDFTRSFLLFLTFFTLLLLLTAGQAYPQGTASLAGTVTDATGAVVPGVAITARHVATNEIYTTVTTQSGLYRFPSLRVGAYEVTMELAGFKLAKFDNVILTVGETFSLDTVLEIGEVTDVVTVVAEGVQVVQTTDTTLSSLVDTTTVSMLPLEFREPSAFVNLMPGIVDGNSINEAIGDTSRGAAVHGARSGTGNFTVDGFDNNDQGQGGRGGSAAGLGLPGSMVGISPEAVQEFRVVTSNFEAQHGRAGGFVSNVTLKSGTNSIHGSLFEYNRVQALAANSWASNSAGIKDTLVRNQFGGSIGGPVVQDKTFFFTSLEFHRLRTSSPTTVTSVTPEFIEFVRSGQFAAFHESDPGGLCMQYNGVPCPGAFALSSTLGPMVGSLVDEFGFPVPTSNLTNIGGGMVTSGIEYPVNVYGTAAGLDTAPLDQNRFSLKIDHSFSDKDKLSGTYLFDDIDQGGSFGGDFFNPAFPFENPARNQIIGLTHTHIWSNTMISELRAGYLRDRSDFPSLLEDEPPSIWPNLFDPMTTSLGRTSGLPQYFTNNQFQFQGNFSIVHGAHTFKVGAEYRRTSNGSAFEALKNGEFDFNDIESTLTDGAFGDETDLVIPDVVNEICGGPCGGGLGLAAVNPQTGELPEFYRGFRANELGLYFQDNWRVHPHFTINYGIRWEYQGPPHNFRPGLDSNFYFGSALLPDSWASCDDVTDGNENPFFPCDSAQFRRVANGQFVQKDNNIWAKDTNNFAPRFGFAWDIGGKQQWVLRGGGGVFYDRIWNNLYENIRFNPPFHSFSGTGALFDGVPVGPLSNPGFFTYPIDPTKFLFSGAASPRHVDENLVLPYMQQYYLSIQHEFAQGWAVHASYISTLGRKLTGLIDMNTFPGRTAGIGSSRRPNTSIGQDNSRNNAFKSNYHGMELQVVKRYSYGLQLQANYTFSKSIDEISDAFQGRDALRPSNTLNIVLDRGPSDFDVRHRFVLNFYYELPFLRDNRWLGGWATSAIINLRSGTPFSILADADTNSDGYATDRAAFLGTGNISDLINNGGSPADGYLTVTDANGDPLFGETPTNPSINQGAWIDGALGRNIFTGPGIANVDWSITKKFAITEGSALQLQGNFFNLFNRANFFMPVPVYISSPEFGKATDTFDPRIVQIALRYDF